MSFYNLIFANQDDNNNALCVTAAWLDGAKIGVQTTLPASRRKQPVPQVRTLVRKVLQELRMPTPSSMQSIVIAAASMGIIILTCVSKYGTADANVLQKMRITAPPSIGTIR